MGSQSYGPFFLNMSLPIVIPTLAAVVMVPTACLEHKLRRGRRERNDEAPVFKGFMNLPRPLARWRCLRRPMTPSETAAWSLPYRPASRLAGVTAFTLFSLYPALVASIATILNCTDAIGGKRYLLADLTVECYKGGHVAMIVCACIASVVYAAGIPLAVVAVVALKTPIVCRGSADPDTGRRPFTAPRCVCARRDEAKYATSDVRTRFGFLFAGYATNRSGIVVSWEGLVMNRKLAVTLVGSTISDPYLQVLSALLILVVSCVLTAFVQPFEILMLNVLDVSSLFALIVTQILSIVYFYSESVDRPFMNAQVLENLITVMLFILNIACIVMFAVAYVVELASLRQRCSRRGMSVAKIVTNDAIIARALGGADVLDVLTGGGDGAAGDAVLDIGLLQYWFHPAGIAVLGAPVKSYDDNGAVTDIFIWNDAEAGYAMSRDTPELLIVVESVDLLAVGDQYRWIRHRNGPKASPIQTKPHDVEGAACFWETPRDEGVDAAEDFFNPLPDGGGGAAEAAAPPPPIEAEARRCATARRFVAWARLKIGVANARRAAEARRGGDEEEGGGILMREETLDL